MLELVEQITNKELDPRHLHMKDRLGIVAYLGHESGFSHAEIAKLLHITDRTVRRDIRRIQMNAAGLVKDITINRVAGGFIKAAHSLYAKAIRGKDYALAWQIQKDMIDKLRQLGFKIGTPGSIPDGTAGPGRSPADKANLRDVPYADLLASLRTGSTERAA